MEFHRNDWNLDHATSHGVSVTEAESLIRNGRSRRIGDNKFRVRGRGVGGRLIQAIYVVDPDLTLYVIHARPLTDSEKKNFRKSKP
jgi:uncharacterized DUF497 family protein